MLLSEQCLSEITRIGRELLTIVEGGAIDTHLANLAIALTLDQIYIQRRSTDSHAIAPLSQQFEPQLQQGQPVLLGHRCLLLPLLTIGELLGWLVLIGDRAPQLATAPTIDGLMLFASSLSPIVKATQQSDQIVAYKAYESRFQDLLETIEDVVWEVDHQLRYTYVSPQIERLLGLHPDALIGQTLHELMRSTTIDSAAGSLTVLRAVQQRQSFSRVETTRIHRDGHKIVVESNGTPFFDANGDFAGYRGIERDITDRKAAEAEFYQQNALIELRAIVDSILARDLTLPDMLQQCTSILVQQLNVGVVRIWTYDAPSACLELQASAGNDISSNHYYQKVPLGELAIGLIAQERQALLTNDIQSEPRIKLKEWAIQQRLTAFAGYPLVVGEDLLGVIALFSSHDLPDDTLEMLSFIAGEIASGIQRQQAEAALAQSEARLRQKANALKNALHQLRTTQAQLVQSEKMSSLGQLVAGIAHEINNPVNFIQGNVRYSQDYLMGLLRVIALYQQEHTAPSPALQRTLDELDLPFIQQDLPKVLQSMEMGTARIQEIVSTLKVFACLDETGVKPIDIEVGINSALTILQNRLAQNQFHIPIAVVCEFGQIPAVQGLVGHLNQVFMNLLTNAIDALHEAINQQAQPQPKITITTTQIDAHNVCIEISDNASGMSPALQRQIFDPFFTTKPIGQGTGLGLSTCYQVIVNEHGGTIDCQSKVGEGTRFIIHLPLRGAAPTAVAIEPNLDSD